jgi:hypothetical protein
MTWRNLWSRTWECERCGYVSGTSNGLPPDPHALVFNPCGSGGKLTCDGYLVASVHHS